MASSGIGFIESASSLADKRFILIDEADREGNLENQDFESHETLPEDDLNNQLEIDNLLSTSTFCTNDDMNVLDGDVILDDEGKLSLKNGDSCEDGIDSDSDVEFVETPKEVIELSDDDSKECADILKDLFVPDSIIGGLMDSSNIISMKIRKYLKNNSEIRDVITEIPNQTWSLPWKVVTNLFNNPSLEIKSKPKPTRQTKTKIQEHRDDDETKIKKRTSLASSVKLEKTNLDESDISRLLPICHFGTDKPPEFLEFSRSGRLRKKPNRLRDSLNVFNIENKPQRRKSNQSAGEKINSAGEFSNESNLVQENELDIINVMDSTSSEDKPVNLPPQIHDSQDEKLTFLNMALNKKPYNRKSKNQSGDDVTCNFSDASNKTWSCSTSSESDLDSLYKANSSLSGSSRGSSRSKIKTRSSSKGASPKKPRKTESSGSSRSSRSKINTRRSTKVASPEKPWKTESSMSSHGSVISDSEAKQHLHNTNERARRLELGKLFKGLKYIVDPDRRCMSLSKIAILNGAYYLINNLSYGLERLKKHACKLKSKNEKLSNRLDLMRMSAITNPYFR